MRLIELILSVLLLSVAVDTCAMEQNDDRIECRSLLGVPLKRPDLPPDRRARLEEDLTKARADYEANPEGEDAAIWYGRRLAYLGHYRDAIDVFSAAIEKHPRSYKLLRHRGHRYITLRELDKAIEDLTRAAELSKGATDQPEPDGAPNAKDIPRSTNLSNIWYHLALAHYLEGDFAQAAECWQKCLELPKINADIEVSTTYWLYLSLRRAGNEAQAAQSLDRIGRVMPVIENQAYHRLLLMFTGELTEADVLRGVADDPIADATIGYGIGVWKLLNGDRAGAAERFEQIVKGSNWAPFGYIAAEAELARGKSRFK